MAFGFNFSGSRNKTTYSDQQTIDPQARALQEQNYASAQGLAANYAPTSRAQIDQQYAGYEQNVINPTMSALERWRDSVLSGARDHAQKASAFGTMKYLPDTERFINESFGNHVGLLGSQLRYQGYDQSQNRAVGENRFSYAYPLERQGLLNSTLAGITPNVTRSGKSKSRGWDVEAFLNSKGASGGGENGADFDTMQYVASMFGF